jgi:hypothetical protein
MNEDFLLFCILKAACHSYTFSLQDDVEFTGTITNHDGTFSEEISSDSPAITLPKDDIYYATITYTNPGDETVYTAVYPIFEFCDLFECVQGLILALWCKDKDCCDNCDDKADAKKRYTLNKMMAAYQSLMMLTNKYKTMYLGYNCTGDAEKKYIAEIYEIWKTLRALVETCGECKTSKIYHSSPCKTC